MPSNLPIEAIRPDLIAALRAGRRFLLQAPTGSGKSTQVPQMLVDEGLAGNGMVVILQPRRIAARLLARRVAEERGSKPGEEVGYQVRLDNVSSARTSIKYVTEGLLLRQILGDPRLPGVGTILFDEFHERHLHGDVTLAQALAVQAGVRPDLQIGVMSATLDVAGLETYLAPCAVLRSEGRTFPVEIDFRPPPLPGPGAAEPPVWDQAAATLRAELRAGTPGDALIFMPGAYEIRRTLDALRELPEARDCELLPLHGELPPEEQDAAVARYSRRKIVVATNVAETSLTIDGVRLVIDSGLARVPVFDPQRGINTLLVTKISQASAEQRAGRAGRTAPGRALRLWAARDHAHRPARELAEIRRLDLAEMLLGLLAGGLRDVRALRWLEPPEPRALARAESLLRDLGALDAAGEITSLGRTLGRFPLHPRQGRMFLAAAEAGCLPAMARIAALAQGRSIILPLDDKRAEAQREDALIDAQTRDSDLLVALRAWELAAEQRFDFGFCRQWGLHAVAARQAGDLARQFLDLARGLGLDTVEGTRDPAVLRRCILMGYPDQLARRLDRSSLRCALVHGRRGELRRQSAVHHAPLLVCTEIEERELRGEVVTLLGQATAVEESWLRDCFPDDFSETRGAVLDEQTRRVVRRQEKRFRDLVLETRDGGDAEPGDAARILASAVQAGDLVLKGWNQAVEDWILRLNFAALHCPDYGFAPITEEDRRLIIEDLCLGAQGYKDVRDKEVLPVVRGWIQASLLPILDRVAPERFDLPGPRSVRLRYEKDGRAILSATVQQLYDVPMAKLRIADGRASLRIELLAPSRRPVQITDDLDAFWTGSYAAVKKDLKGRYPKHEWR